MFIFLELTLGVIDMNIIVNDVIRRHNSKQLFSRRTIYNLFFLFYKITHDSSMNILHFFFNYKKKVYLQTTVYM